MPQDDYDKWQGTKVTHGASLTDKIGYKRNEENFVKVVKKSEMHR